jgi:hypothetical protein
VHAALGARETSCARTAAVLKGCVVLLGTTCLEFCIVDLGVAVPTTGLHAVHIFVGNIHILNFNFLVFLVLGSCLTLDLKKFQTAVLALSQAGVIGFQSCLKLIITNSIS